MTVLPQPSLPSRPRRALEVAVDLVIATALIWTLPLLLGAAAAIARFLLD